VNESDWGSATRRSIFWSAVSFAGARTLTFISVVVLARLLAPADFGVVAAIALFIAMIEVISDVGMKATVVYEQEKGITERVHTAFTVNVTVAALLCAAAVLLAPLVAGFFRMADHTDLFRLASLNLLLTGLGNVHDSLLMRDLEFRRRVIPDLARGVAYGCTSIALAVAGYGPVALVAGLLAGTAAWTTFQWVLASFRPRLSFDGAIARSMVSYGSGAFSLSIIGAVAGIVPLSLIGRILGEHALGLYSVARRVPELAIEGVVYNVSRVYFPALSRKRATDERAVGGATLTVLRYQALCVAPAAAALAVLASPLVVVLFSDKWSEAGPVLSAVAVLSGVACTFFPLGDALKAIGRQWQMVALNAFQIPCVAIGIVLIAPHGIVAVVWLMAAASLTFLAGMAYLVSRSLDIGPRALLAAARPGLVAAAGVVVGAGTVRLGWSELSAGPLLAGMAAAAAGGLLFLRMLAPGVLTEVGDALGFARFLRKGAFHAAG
jgi:lipopolysaccharide exporter